MNASFDAYVTAALFDRAGRAAFTLGDGTVRFEDGAQVEAHDGAQAIQAGQVDALLQDLPVNLEHTRKGKFVIAEEYDTAEAYGLAMKKGNDALVKAVNEQLAKLKSSGEYQKIYDKYFKAK